MSVIQEYAVADCIREVVRFVDQLSDMEARILKRLQLHTFSQQRNAIP